MARAKIPNALKMRQLKYGEVSDAEREAVAAALRDQGRRAEALLLYERTPDHPSLAEEARWAVSEGDAFHLLSLQRMGREVSEQEFRDCARAAEDRARWMYARQCYEAIGDLAAVRAIAEHLPPSLRPPAEPDELAEDEAARD